MFGRYFPPPVRAVEIPKPHGGGVRVLGVPTIADRVAQTVVAMYLEERVEPRFHPDSYGYRPKRPPSMRSRCAGSGAGARTGSSTSMSRSSSTRCRGTSSIKAVEAVTDTPWVLLYVKRWLAAPLQLQDGTVVERDRGTPQGSAVSPILANLFMHFAFDNWLDRNFPDCPFERYADDAVVHCVTRRQAEAVLAAIAERMEEVGLRLHPDKTQIVYCQDGRRRGEHEHTSFTFLGFTFRARGARNSKDGSVFTSFLPAMSTEAFKAKSAELRSMRIHRRTTLTLGELARWLNPIVSGWIQYYGRFYRTAMNPLLQRINTYLRRWAGRKYRRLRALKRFMRWWDEVLNRAPGLFPQWKWVRRVLTDG